ALPAAKLGNSEEVMPGQMVLAVGSPFGLDQTVTIGHVSAMGRHGFQMNKYEQYIQTDAAINPGNSGGPLIDLSGRVVGINTAIVPYAQGIGFAVPVNMAKQVMDDLIRYGSVKRGWLGVYIQPLTRDFAEAYGIEEENGAVISDVLADSPAEKAGLQRGDVILTVNGEKIKDHQEFVSRIRQRLSGEKVTLGIIRQKKKSDVPVTLGEMPGNEGTAITASSDGAKMLKDLGLEVAPVSEEIQKKHNLKNREGLAVTAVEEGSYAARGGIREGDILLEVNGIRLKKAGDLEKVASRRGRSTVLLVWRDGRTFFVSIRGRN
ncbi:MAG TPA: PDZ domain-containing protein, partial [Aminivibrio sp.]|nr:PDZ domain-containing protein [Aminivibrio sp.]